MSDADYEDVYRIWFSAEDTKKVSRKAAACVKDARAYMKDA